MEIRMYFFPTQICRAPEVYRGPQETSPYQESGSFVAWSVVLIPRFIRKSPLSLGRPQEVRVGLE